MNRQPMLSLPVRMGLESYGLEGVYARLARSREKEKGAIVYGLFELNGTPIRRGDAELWIRQQEAAQVSLRARRAAAIARYNRIRALFMLWMTLTVITTAAIMATNQTFWFK